MALVLILQVVIYLMIVHLNRPQIAGLCFQFRTTEHCHWRGSSSTAVPTRRKEMEDIRCTVAVVVAGSVSSDREHPARAVASYKFMVKKRCIDKFSTDESTEFFAIKRK